MMPSADLNNYGFTPPQMANVSGDGLNILDDFIEMFRQAEIACGPSSLKLQNLPAADADVNIKAQWFRQASPEIVRYIIGAEKNRKFRFCRKSERALINQRESFVKSINKKLNDYQKKKKITQSEYDKQINTIDNKIKAYEALAQNYAEDSVNKVRTIDSINKTIKNLYSLRESYSKMEVVPDSNETGEPTASSASPDSADSSDPTDSADPTASADSSDPTDSADPTASTDSADQSYSVQKNISKSENVDKESNNIREEKINNKKSLTGSKKSSKSDTIKQSGNDGTVISRTDSIEPEDGYAINPVNGEYIKVYSMKHRMRMNELLQEGINTMMRIKATTLTVRGEHGEEFELNPATMTEVYVKDKDGKIKARLDMALLLNPDTPEREALKEQLNVFHYGQSLMNILTEVNGRLTISPSEFLGVPSQILGARPLFVKQGMSEQHAIKYTVDSAVMLTPKSRLVKQDNFLNDGDYFSKQHMVEISNGLTRALSPIAKLIRSILFKNVEVWHNDETTFICQELTRPSDDSLQSGRSKNYVWVLVTGKHEKYQGVVYLAARSREKQEFFNQFEGSLTPDKLAIRALVTDGYLVYSSAVEELEEMLGRKVKHACCYFHLRQYFIEALELMQIDDIFYAVCTGNAKDYYERVENECKKRNVKLSYKASTLLFITFLIELILRLDEDFADKDKATLEDRRHRLSATLVSQMYDEIEALIRDTKGASIETDKNGKQKVKSEFKFGWTEAVTYAINNKEALTAFLDDGDIELTDNIAELMIRDVVRTRKTSQHFYSEDGYRAYADLMTIIKTAMLLNINPYIYIQWALDNIKLRVEEYRLSRKTGSTAQICFLPKPITVQDENDKTIRLGLYSEDYDCCFDKINVEGLDPWTYDEVMGKEMQRLKNPVKENE